MKIVPGILVSDVKLFEDRVRLVEKFDDKFSWVQVDFIDGIYANNKTIRPSDVKLSKKLKLKYEAHLMVDKRNFTEWLNAAIEAGFHRILTQIESLEISQSAYVNMVKKAGCEVGISLDEETAVEVIDSNVYELLSVVQVMTIKSGFSGQKMNPLLLNKVQKLVRLRDRVPEWQFKIQVDGGVALSNFLMLKDFGVDMAEANSALFGGQKEFVNAKEMERVFKTNLNSFNKL